MVLYTVVRLAAIVATAQALPHARELGIGDPGSGDAGYISGYVPGTDVTSHASIDMDQAAIENALKEKPVNYAAAKAIYDGPGVSLKPTRTIKGFSTAAGAKLTGEAEYDKFLNYYGDSDYADKWVTAALTGKAATFKYSPQGDADFAAVGDDDTRIQAIKKGTVYLNIWMYAIHELEAAIKKCKTDSTDNNNAAVHAWDEGVAFFAGSLQGDDGSGSGKLMYALANKRCKNFKTCGASGGGTSGNSQANTKIFAAFNQGKADLEGKKCSAVRASADKVIAHGFVPLIQGTLKYGWGTDRSLKAKAEGATFAAGILGRLNACSAADAKIVYDNMKIGATSTDFAAVKSALERQYGCMKITCEDVGGFLASSGEYNAGATPCTGTPSNVNPDAAPAKDPCFPNSATVTMADGSSKAISALKAGDQIVAATAEGGLTTDTVSVLSLARPEATANFLKLTTAAANLTLTPEHHVPTGASCCSELKQAKDIAVGDTLYTTAAGVVTKHTVSQIAKVAETGLHSPVLTGGSFPLVSGVVTSFDSIERVTLAKKGLAYLEVLCQATDTCNLFRKHVLVSDRKYIDGLEVAADAHKDSIVRSAMALFTAAK